MKQLILCSYYLFSAVSQKTVLLGGYVWYLSPACPGSTLASAIHGWCQETDIPYQLTRSCPRNPPPDSGKPRVYFLARQRDFVDGIKLRILSREIILDYLDGSNVFTGVFLRGSWKGQSGQG